jgi:iron complex outermembrane recepter protein
MKKIFALAAICIALHLSAFTQVSIKGNVYDAADHSPLKGASIKIQDSYNSFSSVDDGSFSIMNLKKGKQQLEVSYLGYETQKFSFVITRDTSITFLLNKKSVLADEVVIKAIRAGDNTPMTSVKLDNKQLAEKNLGQDITYLLNQTPSTVVTSDAGAGVGYTGLRIRGSDASRINVTINGIPVNDAESAGTYWVDLPDIASSVDNIQIQRGVGSSTNGAGAFGASLNIQTTKLNEDPYAAINSSFGSFNTLKNTVSFGTGLLKDKWVIDGRMSKLNSDGFIDRAFSDLKSFYVSGGYYGKKSILKLIVFSGKERTYQAWYGIPEARLNNDTAAMHQLLLNGSVSQAQYDNMISSDSRTFNMYTYSNQTDNYQQDYYQLHYSYELNKFWNMNAALHYTKGAGYYEEYRNDDAFSKYGLDNVIVGADTITSTNLIRQRWLDNDFYGATYSVNYDNHKKLQATIGGAANQYVGAHYGNVIWAQFASNSTPDLKYYNDSAKKNDVNIFGKIDYQLTKKLSVYGDLQYRTIYYSFFGFDDNLQNIQQAVNLNFINPKVGLMFRLNNSNSFYASYAIGNKEPNRDDYVQSTPASRPKHEHMQNIEAGYSHIAGIWMVAANYYYMYYRNQLVLTGQINDVGAYNRTNIDKSYRSGIELQAGVKPLKNMDIQGNIAFSKNVILNYTEYIDNWDDWSQQTNILGKTDISFSPSVVAGGSVRYTPLKNFDVAWYSKYVGKQYLDNSSNPDRMLKAWFVNDLQLSYIIKPKFVKEISLNLMVNNILNKLFESNGWTYSYIYGAKQYTENWYYPQAGRNFLMGVGVKF